MSKYTKFEDVIKKVEEHILPDFRGKVRTILSDLPTIEVNEDKVNAVNGIVAKPSDWNDLLVPKVSEDCISKAYLEQEIEREVLSDTEPDIHYGWNWALNKVAEIIRNAPSVVPSRAEGKWKGHGMFCVQCDRCGKWAECRTNYCPNCGAKMEGADE